jgi:hypothetical protein
VRAGRPSAAGPIDLTEQNMNPAAQVLTRVLTVDLIGPHGTRPVASELRYSRSDPYAVELAFNDDGGQVVWRFGRDLLMRGTHEPTGHGDVHVMPGLDPSGRAVVVLQFVSPAGAALVEARSADVLTFLAHSTHEVWPGTEGAHIAVDDTVAALLVDG